MNSTGKELHVTRQSPITEKRKNQVNFKDKVQIYKMVSIENLTENCLHSVASEPSIFRYLNDIEILNCSEALIGTVFEEFVTKNFLTPQLKIYASLDPSLKESLENKGWCQECQDFELIVKLWKEYKPLKGIIYSFT